MQIRSKTLRRLLVLGTFVVAIIIVVQLYWLQKIYYFEQKQFNINVSKSIRSLYEEFNISGIRNFEANIENPKPDTYIARVDSMPDFEKVSYALSRELTDFDIFTDCKIGFYDIKTQSFRAERYIDQPDANFKPRKDVPLPVIYKAHSYIILYFPNRNRYVIKQMMFWIVSGALLILVLIALAFSIFYLYHQKFLNETQKEFVNNFTHEFKTPLSVIKIAADVLREPSIKDKPEKLKNYASIIQEQTLHLQQQTDRLLQIAFTEHKAISLHMESFDASTLIQQTVDDLYPMIEQAQGIVSILHHTEHTMVNADRSYLKLIFINLIENAVKYSKKPCIEISTFMEDGDLCISFKDNGIGIEKKHQKKIFDKFYRVTLGDVHNVNGFGLGLSFVEGIIHAHKGDIKVQSVYGKGSLFTIKIPGR